MERHSCPEQEGTMPNGNPATLVLHGPTTLKVMHRADLARQDGGP
jgi:hypothetical protein